MCETTDYTAYTILIITIVYTKWKRTVYIYSVQLTSLNKKGRNTDTQSSRTQSYSGIPRLHFDNLATSPTVERGNVYFSLYQKGRGTDTVLSQVQSLGLRTKTFNISDLRKTLSTQITSLQAESVLQRSPLEKKGRGTDPAIAVSSRKKRGVARTQ